MRQFGACVTDVALFACFFGAAAKLRQNCPDGKMPRWCASFVWACMSGCIACFGGSFMWALELNLRLGQEMKFWEIIIGDVMAIGMFGEALGLFAACVGMLPSVDDQAFNKWAQASVFLELLCCLYMAVGHLMGLPFSYLLLPFASVGAALVALVCLSGAHAVGVVPVAHEAKSPWQWVFLGSVVTFAGAAVMGACDNDCAGPYCVTEPFPWESSPCRWNLATPPGSSCLFPEAFNHAAVMHTFAMVGVSMMAHGLQGLLACGWEPKTAVAAAEAAAVAAVKREQ